MTCAEQLAGFVSRASFEDISNAARLQLKIRILDALGCAIGAMAVEPSHCCEISWKSSTAGGVAR